MEHRTEENKADIHALLKYRVSGLRAKDFDVIAASERLGKIAMVLSIKHNGTIGVVITASHNPAGENGVKFVSADGNMVGKTTANQMNNMLQMSEEDFDEMLKQITSGNMQKPPSVIVGCDTRDSSVVIESLISQGIYSVLDKNISHISKYPVVKRLGVVPTPVVHFLVRTANIPRLQTPQIVFNALGMNSYLEHLTTCCGNAYYGLSRMKNCSDTERNRTVVIDCANGAAAAVFASLQAQNMVLFRTKKMHIANEHGEINHKCGSDYVLKNRRIPVLRKNAEEMECPHNTAIASFDGDADRLVYAWYDSLTTEVSVIDGDRQIFILLQMLNDFSVRYAHEDIFNRKYTGIVLTMYSNGGLDTFLRKTVNTIEYTETGIANLQDRAKKMIVNGFHIVIMYEYNGHGTIIVSQHVLSWLKRMRSTEPAAMFLWGIISMLDPMIGDAIANFCAMEMLFLLYGFDINYIMSTYGTTPSMLSAKKVSDRSIYPVDSAMNLNMEKIFPSLQKQIEEYNVTKYLVRLSNTENLVRIYIEADTDVECTIFAGKIVHAIEDFEKKIKNTAS